MKLPISLLVIARNSKERVSAFFKNLNMFEERVYVDQDSDDGSLEAVKDLVHISVRRRRKGFVEPDRQFGIGLCHLPWILVLDDDESLSNELLGKLPVLVNQNRIHVWFFPRKNFVDGKDVSHLLGEDYQCRLFQRGAINWPSQMHAYPTPARGVMAGYVSEPLIHTRTLDGLKKANRARNRVASPEIQRAQEAFIAKVEEALSNGG